MRLPTPRGPLSSAVVTALRLGDVRALGEPGAPVGLDPVTNDDLQLALWTCYELHYRGFDGVDEDWEWSPELLAVRRGLEDALLTALGTEVAVPVDDGDVPGQLQALTAVDDGPSLSRYLQREASRGQFLEFVVHRSLYQLKEADPHSWALPRLAGAAKAALVEIQFGEYGEGNPARGHSELYRTLLRALELNDGYGAYVDIVPGITLAVSNVMSLFGLRRALRGALAGHLAAYELTSSEPCRRYARALRRLRAPEGAGVFYDEHVTADALHEQLAAHDLCGSLAEEEPDLGPQILFGAAVHLHIERRFAQHLLDCWSRGASSLLRPLDGGGPVPLRQVS